MKIYDNRGKISYRIFLLSRGPREGVDFDERGKYRGDWRINKPEWSTGGRVGVPGQISDLTKEERGVNGPIEEE